MSDTSSVTLFRTPGGIAVGLLGVALLCFSVIALGQLLVGVIAAALLVGGYVVVHLSFRVVRAFERLVAAVETMADARREKSVEKTER